MGTTTLTNLETALGVLIGDSNSDYSGNYDNAINNASQEISDVLFIPLDNTDDLTVVEGDYRYELPSDFQDGHLSQVQIEISSDEEDLNDARWETVYDWKIISDGTTKNLILPRLYTEDKIIRLIGYKLLEQLSSGTSTISIEAEQVSLLLHYAAFKLFEIESQEIQYIIDSYTDDITDIDTGIDSLQDTIDDAVTAVATVASEDISRYDALIVRNQGQIDRDEAKRNRIAQKRSESKGVMGRLKERSIEWLGKYYRLLPSLRMTPPTVTMKVRF